MGGIRHGECLRWGASSIGGIWLGGAFSLGASSMVGISWLLSCNSQVLLPFVVNSSLSAAYPAPQLEAGTLGSVLPVMSRAETHTSLSESICEVCSRYFEKCALIPAARRAFRVDRRGVKGHHHLRNIRESLTAFWERPCSQGELKRHVAEEKHGCVSDHS